MTSLLFCNGYNISIIIYYSMRWSHIDTVRKRRRGINIVAGLRRLIEEKVKWLYYYYYLLSLNDTHSQYINFRVIGVTFASFIITMRPRPTGVCVQRTPVAHTLSTAYHVTVIWHFYRYFIISYKLCLCFAHVSYPTGGRRRGCGSHSKNEMTKSYFCARWCACCQTM